MEKENCSTTAEKITAFERELLDSIYKKASLVEMAYCTRLNIKELLVMVDSPDVAAYLKTKVEDYFSYVEEK